MTTAELIERVKKSAKTRTQEETTELLIKAKILTKEGYYNKKYFTKETVEKSKTNKKRV